MVRNQYMEATGKGNDLPVSLVTPALKFEDILYTLYKQAVISATGDITFLLTKISNFVKFTNRFRTTNLQSFKNRYQIY